MCRPSNVVLLLMCITAAALQVVQCDGEFCLLSREHKRRVLHILLLYVVSTDSLYIFDAEDRYRILPEDIGSIVITIGSRAAESKEGYIFFNDSATYIFNLYGEEYTHVKVALPIVMHTGSLQSITEYFSDPCKRPA